MEVLVLGRLKGLESKIVNDEQIDVGEGREPALEGLGGAGGLKLSQQLALGGEDHIVAAADRLMTQGLGDVTLARACGSGDEHRGLLFHEAAGGQVHDLGLVDVGVEGEVEAFEGLLRAEAGSTHPKGELLVFTPGHLVLDEKGEELAVGELLVDGLTVSQLE